MCLLDGRFAHTYQVRIFYCVNNVFIDDTAFCSLCHQNHVIAFHETDETQNTVRTNFLNAKKNRYEYKHIVTEYKGDFICTSLTLHCPSVPTKPRIPLASYSLGYSWIFSSVRWVRSISRQRNFVSRSLLPTSNKRCVQRTTINSNENVNNDSKN